MRRTIQGWTTALLVGAGIGAIASVFGAGDSRRSSRDPAPSTLSQSNPRESAARAGPHGLAAHDDPDLASPPRGTEAPRSPARPRGSFVIPLTQSHSDSGGPAADIPDATEPESPVRPARYDVVAQDDAEEPEASGTSPALVARDEPVKRVPRLGSRSEVESTPGRQHPAVSPPAARRSVREPRPIAGEESASEVREIAPDREVTESEESLDANQPSQAVPVQFARNPAVTSPPEMDTARRESNLAPTRTASTPAAARGGRLHAASASQPPASRPAPPAKGQPARRPIAPDAFQVPNSPSPQTKPQPQAAQPPAKPGMSQEEALKAFQTGVDVQGVDSAGVIVIQGSKADVEAMLEVIRAIDSVSSTIAPFVRVFQLHRASASQVRDTIQELYSGQATGGGGGGGGGASQQAIGGGVQRQFRIAVNERTNTLIVQASMAMMEELDELILRLDADKAPTVNQVRVFKLRNAQATEIAELLNSALSAGGTATTGGQGQVPGGQAGGTTTGGEARLARRFAVLELVLSDGKEGKTIDSGILDEVRVTAQERTNSVLVSAPATSMPLMEALIQELDQPPTLEAVTKVFLLENSDATNMRTTLGELFDIESSTTTGLGGAGAGLTTTQFQRPVAVAPGDAPPISVRIAIDARTNSLLVTGPQSVVDVVEAVIRKLDSNDVQTRKNRVYRLKNARATDVATALTNFYTSKRQIEVQQAQTTGLAGGQQALVGAFQRLEQEVVVVPLQDTQGLPINNMILISASPRYFNELIQFIDEMDAIQPQVLVQVMIAQLDISDDMEFGIQWGIQDSLLFDRSEVTGTGNSSTFASGQGYNFNNAGNGGVGNLGNSASELALRHSNDVGGQGVTNFVLGRASSISEFGGASGLLLTASSESVSAMLRALQGQGRLEVVSRPQIMTLDGVGASVQVGERIPYAGPVTQGQTSSTTSVQYENVGVVLDVTPTISPDGKVLLRIVPTVSEVREFINVQTVVTDTGNIAQVAPRVNTITANTVVTVLDGQTLVLGGLIQRRNQDTVRKIPWLGDVPYLGALFRFTQEREFKRELLFIMTPHIVRNQAEADRVRALEIERSNWILQHSDIHPELAFTLSATPSGTPPLLTPPVDASPPSGAAVPLAPSRSTAPSATPAPLTPPPSLKPPELPKSPAAGSSSLPSRTGAAPAVLTRTESTGTAASPPRVLTDPQTGVVYELSPAAPSLAPASAPGATPGGNPSSAARPLQSPAIAPAITTTRKTGADPAKPAPDREKRRFNLFHRDKP